MTVKMFGKYLEVQTVDSVNDENLGFIQVGRIGFFKHLVDEKGKRLAIRCMAEPSLSALCQVMKVLTALEKLVEISLDAIEAPDDYIDEPFQRDQIELFQVTLEADNKIALSFNSCFKKWNFWPIVELEEVNGLFRVCFWDWSN